TIAVNGGTLTTSGGIALALAAAGIRVFLVGGVPTCGLPISFAAGTKVVVTYGVLDGVTLAGAVSVANGGALYVFNGLTMDGGSRSEERRVGKEVRGRRGPQHEDGKGGKDSGRGRMRHDGGGD